MPYYEFQAPSLAPGVDDWYDPNDLTYKNITLVFPWLTQSGEYLDITNGSGNILIHKDGVLHQTITPTEYTTYKISGTADPQPPNGYPGIDFVVNNLENNSSYDISLEADVINAAVNEQQPNNYISNEAFADVDSFTSKNVTHEMEITVNNDSNWQNGIIMMVYDANNSPKTIEVEFNGVWSYYDVEIGNPNWQIPEHQVTIPLTDEAGVYTVRLYDITPTLWQLTYYDWDHRITEVNITSTTLTNLQGMFKYCVQLQKVTFPTISPITMTDTFYNCYDLTTISGLDYSNVTSLQQTFYGCSSLTSIPYMNTSNVQDFVNAFGYCSSLVCLTNLNTTSGLNGANSKVGMFHNTPLLQQPDISAQADLTSVNGADWTNANPCP